jgi:Arc/MetJ-type ribon-helix-helix transcriptional regulator
VKLSVSIPDNDVEFIDHYAGEHGLGTRSGVVQRALLLLRASELGDDYAAAWREWADAGDELWDTTIADGLESDPG